MKYRYFVAIAITSILTSCSKPTTQAAIPAPTVLAAPAASKYEDGVECQELTWHDLTMCRVTLNGHTTFSKERNGHGDFSMTVISESEYNNIYDLELKMYHGWTSPEICADNDMPYAVRKPACETVAKHPDCHKWSGEKCVNLAAKQ